MRVLCCTSKTQGDEPNDFCWTSADELATLGFVCCNADDCGCNRSFIGVNTRKATTSAIVAEFDGTWSEYLQALRQSQMDAYPGSYLEDVDFIATYLHSQATKHHVGTVLGVRQWEDGSVRVHVRKEE